MTRGLAIVGYGKMGRMIERLAPEYGFEVKAKFSGQGNDGARALTAQSMIGVDVAGGISRTEDGTGDLEKVGGGGGGGGWGKTGGGGGVWAVGGGKGVGGGGFG